MKICTVCRLEKTLTEFSVDRHLKSGILSSCKTCSSLRTRMYQRTELGHRNKLKHKRVSNKRRRDMKRGLDTRLTSCDINDIYTRFDHKCFNCGAIERLEIDHHRPLSLGYGLTPKNAVLLCGACNVRKSNRLPEEFYTQEQVSRLAQLMP